MPLFTDAARQFRQMDRFSCGNTGFHRLDARIKIGAFIVFQICVLSWPPQEITGQLPFFLFPFSNACFDSIIFHFRWRS